MRTLSKLIAANLDVPRWIFKIDDEFCSRGMAYWDTSNSTLFYLSLLERINDLLLS